jgi:hypothetical protein
MLINYKKYEFYFFRANSIRTSSLSKNIENKLPDPNKFMIENVEFKVVYLSKWSKVPFKIELSIDSLDLEETKTSHINNKKSSSFYSIPIKNVCTCSDIVSSNKIWYSGDLLNKSSGKFLSILKNI